jgi:hypothetical protein
MKTLRIFGILSLPLFAQLAVADGWIAYNDCVDTEPESTPANATNFGLGRSYLGEEARGISSILNQVPTRA